MKTKFPAWFAKNWGLVETFQQHWQIASKHIVRSASYKGQQADVTCIEGIRYDVASILGLFLLYGTLMQIRGISGGIQSNVLHFLRDICSITDWPGGLSILPNITLQVEHGMVSLDNFWDAVPRGAKSAFKCRRQLWSLGE